MVCYYSVIIEILQMLLISYDLHFVAYLMESTSLEYYTQRNCDVTQVGDLIDDRNYAIGMAKGYKYFHALSEGVLILQEKGVLEKLHTKWWKFKRGGGKCEVCIQSVRVSKMEIERFIRSHRKKRHRRQEVWTLII